MDPDLLAKIAGDTSLAEKLAGFLGTKPAEEKTTKVEEQKPVSRAKVLQTAKQTESAGDKSNVPQLKKQICRSVLDPQRLFSLTNKGFGWCVVDGALETNDCDALCAAIRDRGPGDLREAQMGAQKQWKDDSFRSDHIAWITAAWDRNTMFSAAFRVLKELQAQLRNYFPLSDRVSIQLAYYPAGSRGYVKHRDTERQGEETRMITALLYLNPGWDSTKNGGELRIYSPNEEDPHDVEPSANKLLVFQSHLEHEVLGSRDRPRWAITCWFYGIESTSTKVETATDTPLQSLGLVSASSSTAKIFVAIPSYRDPLCARTVISLLSCADHPDTIRVGICWQNEIGAASEFYGSSEHEQAQFIEYIKNGQVRVISLPSSEATGPCTARALIHKTLYCDENFVLNVDSHMQFLQSWDTTLINLLHQAESQSTFGKAVISTYPAGFEFDSNTNTVSLPHKELSLTSLHILTAPILKASHFDDEDCTLRIKASRGGWKSFATVNADTNSQEPNSQSGDANLVVKSQLLAGGFNFSRAETMISTVPYINVPHLFFGEESAMAAMLYTHGFDLFCPLKDEVVFHLWSRAHRQTFKSPPLARLKASRAVANALEEASGHSTLLRVGSRRSMAAWEAEIGVDFRLRKIQPSVESDSTTQP